MIPRSASICLVVLALIGSAAGAVSYDITVDDGDTEINTTFEVYADSDKNIFRTRWSVPRGSDLDVIRDSQGSIDDWERVGEQIEVTSNAGPGRTKETFTFVYTIPDRVTTWKDSIHRVELQLPGFTDQFEQYDEEDTSIRVQTPDPILGLGPPNGFTYSFDDDEAIMEGEGPATFRISYTDVEQQYDHYTAIGDINLSSTDDTYPLLWHITGFAPDFVDSFAVIPLEPQRYNEAMDEWSAATYRQAGLIFVRDRERSAAELTSLMMHETMHGFNQEKLSWVQLDAGVFDEGTAQYAEYITKREQNQRQGELFGGNVTWRAPCEDDPDQQCRYWLQPRGSEPEGLWQYYEQDLSFMQGWSPSDAGTRSFGYAFAELIIRNYMVERDPDALHSVYEAMEDQSEVSEIDAYWETLGTVLDGELAPCKRDTVEETAECTKTINDAEPAVPDEVSIDDTRVNLTFTPVKRDTGNANMTNRTTLPDGTFQEREGFFEQLGEWLRAGITRFLNFIERSQS